MKKEIELYQTGQLTLPKVMRDLLQIQPGDKIIADYDHTTQKVSLSAKPKFVQCEKDTCTLFLIHQLLHTNDCSYILLDGEASVIDSFCHYILKQPVPSELKGLHYFQVDGHIIYITDDNQKEDLVRHTRYVQKAPLIIRRPSTFPTASILPTTQPILSIRFHSMEIETAHIYLGNYQLSLV